MEKIAFKVSKRARKCQDFFFPFSTWTTISFYYILLVDILLLNSVPFTASCYIPFYLCVEMGFTWTFPRNQDAKVKFKSDLISIKF